HPQALLDCDDASILGAHFYLMECIHGIILRRELPAGLQIPAEKARQLDESFIDNLARLHSLDYAAIGLGDLGKPQGYLERQVRGWIERYYGSPTPDPPGGGPPSAPPEKKLSRPDGRPPYPQCIQSFNTLLCSAS